MNQIKQIVSGSHCALINSNIAVLIDGSVDLSSYLNMLQYLLVTNDAVCVCSSPYLHLGQTRQVWNQLQFILDREQPKNGSEILFYKELLSATLFFQFYIMNFRNRHCIILHFTKFRNLICKTIPTICDADLLSAK